MYQFIIRKYWLIYLTLFYVSGVFGQQIEGTVSDTSEQAIEFASLVYWDHSGEKIINYTVSDQLGYYRLEGHQSLGLLVVSSLGYQSDTIVVIAPVENEVLQLDFKLHIATFDLQSIEVSDARIPYKVQGDTVTYRSDFFADGTEQVVEDLIKKLPGVSVSDDGKISYKGKQVDKVLLEDDELFGKKYTIGTRSLRADVVDEVQFIDHYIDNALLKDVAQSDKLAMNITIKEERKKLIFGDSELGGGIPGRYEGKLNAFSLYKKHKAILIGNAENTASSPLDMYTLVGGELSFDDPYEYSRPSRYYANLPSYYPFELKKSEVKNGRVQQGAANFILNPNDKLKIRTYALGFNDRWNLNSSSFFRDLNLGTLYEYADQSGYEEHSYGTELDLEAKWQISTRSNIKYTFNVSANRLLGEANTRVQLPEKDTIPQNIENHNHVHIHRLNWVRKLNDKQVLVVDAAYYADTRVQDFYFDYQSESKPKVEGISQTNVHQVKDADLLASLLGKSGSLKYALSFKYRIQTDQLQAQLFTNDLLKQEVGFTDQLQNDYQQRFLAMIGSFSTHWGIARMFTRLELGHRQAYFGSLSQDTKIHRTLYPNLRSGLTIKINKKSSFSISGSIATQTPELQQLHSGRLFSSYQMIISGVDQVIPYFTYTGLLGFKHSNNAKLMEFSASGVYANNARAYVDRYFYQGIFSIREKQILDGGQHWSISAALDKFMPALSANLGLNWTWSINQSFMLRGDASINKVRLENTGLELSYTTVFKGPLNLGVAASRNWSIYRQLQASGRINSNNQRYGLQYFITLKPSKTIWLKLDTRQIFTNNQGQQHKTLYLGGLKSEYQISSVIRCGFTIHNLWNTRRFNLENLGDGAYSFSEWRLNPRMVLLHAGARF